MNIQRIVNDTGEDIGHVGSDRIILKNAVRFANNFELLAGVQGLAVDAAGLMMVLSTLLQNISGEGGGIDLPTLTQQVIQLTNDMLIAQNDIANLQSNIVTLQGNVTTLQGQYTTLANTKMDKAGGTFTGNVTFNQDILMASDERIKLGIEPVPESNAQNIIEQMRVVSFIFARNHGPQQRSIGVIAQEVEKFAPNLVREIPDKEFGTIKVINWQSIMAMLVVVSQSIMDRLTTLEAKYDAQSI